MFIQSVIIGILLSLIPTRHAGILLIIAAFIFGVIVDTHPNMLEREYAICAVFIVFMQGIYFLIKSKDAESPRA